MAEYTFQCHVTRRMRAMGLQGSNAWVRVSENLIDISGVDGGQVRIRLDDVTRIRVGYVDGRSRTYETRIWSWGAEKPLGLTPTTQTWGAYGDAIRAVANGLVTRQRGNHIERGSSKFDAVFGTVLMGMLVLAAMGVAVFALGNEPWWGRLLVPLLPSAMFGLLLWLAVTRSWPRPIRELSELDVQLPPVRRA